MPVLLAPLAEQRRIVDILEDHFSRLDAAHKQATLARRRLALLDRSALRQERGRLLEDGVREVPLDEACETILGKMLDAKKAVGVATPYLRNANVRWRRFELADVQETPLTEADVRRLRLQDGDILVCEGGEPGRCAVWRGDSAGMAFQKALHRMRVRRDSDFRPHFVALTLEECIRSGRANTLFTGTTIKHLPQEKLRTIKIPVPTMAVQRAVEQRIDAVSQSSVLLAEAHELADRRAKALRKALLAAAFSGRLTGRSSDMDVAERIGQEDAEGLSVLGASLVP